MLPALEKDVVVKSVASLEVSNPSGFVRSDTLISLSLNQLGVVSGPLQVWKDDTAQPSQLIDDNGDGNPDRLVFLTDLGAAATQRFRIDGQQGGQGFSKRTHAEVSIKEGGDWQGRTYGGGELQER